MLLLCCSILEVVACANVHWITGLYRHATLWMTIYGHTKTSRVTLCICMEPLQSDRVRRPGLIREFFCLLYLISLPPKVPLALEAVHLVFCYLGVVTLLSKYASYRPGRSCSGDSFLNIQLPSIQIKFAIHRSCKLCKLHWTVKRQYYTRNNLFPWRI